MLFHGQQTGGIAHYRTKLPALALGCDVALFNGDGRLMETSAKGNDHDVVVMQMPASPWHFKQIMNLQAEGKKVFANVDDYLRALPKMRGKHAFADHFDKKLIERHERCLRLCDGILASTPWLTKKMRSHNRNVAMARNGLDADRYSRLDDLEKDIGPIVGWSGGTGHLGAFMGVLPALVRAMDSHPDIHFLTVGDPLSDLLPRHRDRVYRLPWTDMIDYHRSMQVIDVMLAPAEDNDFYRAKSQLRLYESGMLGIPVLANPMYDELVDGEHGYICRGEDEWLDGISSLCSNSDLRSRMGRQIKKHAHENWTMEARVSEWKEAISSLCNA